MNTNSEIAIIGMSCRFPGSNHIDAFWENLREGVESISFFDHHELLAAGIDPTLLDDPNYVKVYGALSDIDLFDASFFNFSPKEAAIMDPQHRFFLEQAWDAIEHAGYNTETYPGAIGVYAGSQTSYYLLNNLYSNLEAHEQFQASVANDRDFLSTRVSYKLNLKGPSITVQTACSTSLVAVHMACQSLLNGECDMALAGGVSIYVPQKTGYLYEKGMIYSPDGHCRAFDANAQGIVGGSGIGIVVLKRMSDAISDGDCIHAIVKGSAINNDGSVKLSYTAPSIDQQTAAISEAQEIAGISPETVTYVEAHGTGTELGDPIEVAALTQAFRAGTEQKGFCAIGSVKTNVGHLGSAAGIASLIKTVLSLKHKMIPPSLHFEQPNPKIDFANSPFYVNTQLSDWQTGKTPRRAGVSSLGFGGTNAHVVLEEAPDGVERGSREPEEPRKRYQLLVLSAKTCTALETATANLANYLAQHPDVNLADVAYTLQVGRRTFDHRRMVVCQTPGDAVQALETLDPHRVFTHCQEPCHRPITFMFSGQGAQYVNMARELYEVERPFREWMDLCADILSPYLELDLRHILYPSPEQTDAAAQQLKQTSIAQPALFAIEYALAQMWMAWGVQPASMIGHSIGEYVAATLAGVFSLEDALALVSTRGCLMQQLPSGSMIAVPLPGEAVQPWLGQTLSLAAINAPSSCVVSGPTDEIEILQNQLASQGVDCRRLHTSHAFHSQMMEPILESFTEHVKQVSLKPPQIPYLSNVTGTWITPEAATDPAYWVSHLRQTVRFAAGLQELLKEPAQILLEVGPGRTLSQLAKQHPDKQSEQVVLTSIRHPKESQSDIAVLFNTVGRLWLSEASIDWAGFHTHERRHRLPLPTYPFERQRHWIEPVQRSPQGGQFQSLPTASQLWQTFVKASQLQANVGISDIDEQRYLASQQGMDRLCAAYINHALQHLGAFSKPGETYSFQQLLDRCRIIPRYRQLLHQWLQALVEYGYLQNEAEVFTNFIPCSTDSLHTLLENVSADWADTPQIVNLTQHCGEHLASILIGEKEPLEIFNSLIYQEGEISNLEIPLFPYYNSILRSGLQQVVQSLPPEVNLRILEIGGGQGMTTAELLPVLPVQQTNYTFTDVGSWFLTQAQQKFSDYPLVEYHLLDIEKSPQAQGYEHYGFELVIAANVLHVTQNLGETLQHVRSLLAPGGILLLWEITRPQLNFSMTSGLLMNPIVDEGSRTMGNPFLSREQWQDALRAHGFVEVAAFPETNAFGQHILLAQVPTGMPSSIPAAFTVTLDKKATEQQHGASQSPHMLSGKKPDIADWFYAPSWKRSVLPNPSASKAATTHRECWLVFVDECGLGVQLAQQLQRQEHSVITVRTGEQFSRDRPLTNNEWIQHQYTINPQQPNDYDTLLKELHGLNLIPQQIVHLWSVTVENHTVSELPEFDSIQQNGFYSVLFLAQALGRQSFTGELCITALANQLQAVTGEEKLCPEKATLLGLVRVIPQEYSTIHCRSIDVVLPSPENGQVEKLVDHLLAELTAQTADEVIAYRGTHRWIQTLEPVRLDETMQGKPRLRQHGVYLITGGLGAIGLALAEYLAETVQAKLLLIGRSAFPTHDRWSEWLATHDEDDPICLKIQTLQKLEALGSEVLVASTDVANVQQLQNAIAQAKKQFGQINGVIHAAGVLGDGAIQQKTVEQVESVFAPKVRGTLALNTIFKDIQLDFLVLCSSIGSFMPLFGQVAYSGANNFLDAFAHHQTCTDGTFTLSINWDGWQAGGMGIEGTKRLVQTLNRKTAQSQLGISTHPLGTSTHPLIDQCLIKEDEQEIYVSKLSVRKHWILDEHRVRGKAALPGTAYLEIVKAACENHAQGRTLEVREMIFLKLLEVEGDVEKEVRTILKPQDNGFEFLIISQSSLDAQQWQEHARGEVGFVATKPPEKIELQALAETCNQQEIIIAEQVHEPQIGFVELGSRWKNCQWIKLGRDQGLACLELPSGLTDDLNSYTLHPALLDIATSFLTIQYPDQGPYLPFSYRGLRVKGPLPAKIYSYLRVVNPEQPQTGFLKFNITIMDDQGIQLVEIEEYTLRKAAVIAQQSDTQPNKVLSAQECENFYLSISTPGMLDTLELQPTIRQPPGPGEVEIEVSATGLNFLEVLISMNLIQLPGDFIFGRECAGKVVALGDGVEEFELGDDVIAFGSSCFSQFTTTSTKLVAPKPAHLSLEEAATIPTAFTTAYLALISYGKLCQGEKVLIHAASGGVGMAAVQVAKWVGAEIFATAGSPEKRDFLHALGIEHVLDSRSLAFADQVMERTNGSGVDVVLNSLGGEFIPKSLSVLARYGRFLEIGLRDILNNQSLALRPFEKNLSFFSIHLDLEKPNFKALWREVVQHFQDGHFSPLPHQVFPITEVTAAFEYMATAKHIGKIVISQCDRAALKPLMASNGRGQAAREPMTSGTALHSVSSTLSPIDSDSLQTPVAPTNGFQEEFVKEWLLPSEGREVFNRILGSTLPQVLVSTNDLLNRSQQKADTFRVFNAPETIQKADLSKAPQLPFELSHSTTVSKHEIEQVLINILQTTLRIDQISVNDNFFELGGDSLLAVQAIAQARKTFQVDLPTSLLFESPTVAGMATYIERVRKIAEKLQASTMDCSNDREEIEL